MTQNTPGRVSYIEYFGKALTLYADNFAPLINISFFCAAPTLFKALLDRSEDPGLSFIGLVLSPFVLAVYVFFWMCLVHTVSSLATGVMVTLKESMAHVGRLFWRGLGGYVLFSLMVVVGLVLLILPGLYLLTIFYFFIFAIVCEDKTLKDAFGRSRDLVGERFWRVLGAHGLVIFLTLLVTVPVVAGIKMMGFGDVVAMVAAGSVMMLLVPLCTFFYYFIYAELKGEQAPSIRISVTQG